MRRALAVVLLSAVILLLAGRAALRTTWLQTQLRDVVQPLVLEHLNMSVRWDEVAFHPLTLSVEVRGLRAYSGETTAGTPFLQSPKVTAHVSWLELLNRRIDIDPIIVHDPVLRFGNDGENWINFLDIDKIDELASTPASESGGWSAVVRRVRLDNADVDFFLESIDLRAHLVGFTAEGRFDFIADEDKIPIRVSSGRGLYRMFGRDFQVGAVEAKVAVEIIEGPWVDFVIDEALLRGAYPNAWLRGSGRIVDLARRHIFHVSGHGETEVNFLNDVFFDQPALTGTAAYDLRYDGDFEKFRVAGEVTSASALVGDAVVRSFSAQAEVTQSALTVHRSAAQVFGGSARLAGRLGFEHLDWRVDTELAGIDPARLRPFLALPKTAGRIRVAYAGAGAFSESMTTTGRLDFSSASLDVDLPDDYGTLAIREGHGEADVRWDGERLSIGRGRLVTAREEVGVEGVFEPDTGRVDLNFSLQSGDLSVVSLITKFDIAGWGTADGTWTGTLTHPHFDFNVAVRDVALPWFNAEAATGRISVSLDEVYLSDIDAELSGGRAWLATGLISNLSDVPFVDLQVEAYDVPLERAIAPLLGEAVPIGGRFTGVYAMSSPVTALSAYAEGEVRDGFAWGEPLDYAVGKVRIGDEAVVFDGLRGARGRGSVEAFGRFGFEGDVDLRLLGEGVSLDDVAHLAGYGLTGTASAELVFRSARDGPVDVSAVGRGYDVKLRDISLGNVSATLEKAADSVTANAKSGVAEARLNVRLVEGYPGELTVSAPQLDLRPLVAPYLEGDTDIVVGGTATFKGSWDDLSTVRGEAVLDTVNVTQNRTQIRNDGPAVFVFREGDVRFERVALTGDNTAGSLSGRVGFDGRLDLRLRGAVDLQLFTMLIEPLKSAAGALEVDGSISGTIAKPDIRAALKVAGGRLQLRDVNLLFDDVYAHGVFSDGQVVIENMRAKVGPGSLRGGGLLRMEGFVPSSVSLYATLSEAEARIPQWLATRANGRLELIGPIDDVLLRGTLEIVKATYDEKLDWESLILRFNRPKPGLEVLAQKKGLHVDIALQSAGSIFVRNNLVDAKMRGDLRVVGYPPDVGITGNLQVLDGTLIFRENVFEISSAQINFLDESRVRPFLDLKAKARVEESTSTGVRRATDITLEASGPPNDLQIDLESSPPLSREDILSLLYIKRRAGESGAVGGTATAEAVSLAFKLNDDLAGFQSEVQEYFGFENLVLEPAFADTSRSGTMKLRAEKMLRKNLKATVSTSLNSTDFDFWVGYGLTDNVLLDFGWNSIAEDELHDRRQNVGNFKLRPRLHFEFQ